MKHSLRTTLLLVGIFILAQLVGLVVVAEYLDPTALAQGEISWQELPLGFTRPDVAESSSYWYILAAVLVGTALALLLIRFRAVRSWKAWFCLAVLLCLTITLSAFLPHRWAFGIAAFFAIWKVFRPNPIVHNLTEIFLYGGLAAIFVPILNVFSVSMLLLLIAVYDAIAVWHSKHMVKMAQFQSDAKMFAGVFLPSGTPASSGHSRHHRAARGSVAVLGGGDIAFPLLFTGAVLKWLLTRYPLHIAMLQSLVITACVTIALALLLLAAKPKRFYPAMPFLAAGCFVGYGLLWVLN